MAQYIYTMNGVGKVVPPKREILRDIYLSFFPGAKIGVLGLNGSGKSTLLRIMAGVDTEYLGEARPQPGIRIGYLAQEPHLDTSKTVRGNVEEAVQAVKDALERLDALYGEYAIPDADFDVLKSSFPVFNVQHIDDEHKVLFGCRNRAHEQEQGDITDMMKDVRKPHHALPSFALLEYSEFRINQRII